MRLLETDVRQIMGEADPALDEVIFHNFNGIEPVIFKNDHHAVNKCYRIQNGYLIFISSKEGLFKGYELTKNEPKEISGEILEAINEQVNNRAGIYLGIERKDAEKILNQDLNNVETKLVYESVKMIKGISFDVITTVIIGFKNNKLLKFRVITSTTS